MELKALIIEHFIKLVEHIIYTAISLKIIFWLKMLLKIVITIYRTTKDYSKLKVEFNNNGDYIKLDIINFDGYNYIFKLDVDAFNAVAGQTLVATNQISYNLHMSTENISVLDIIKITTCKKVVLSKKTSSNIIRTLTNTRVIK